MFKDSSEPGIQALRPEGDLLRPRLGTIVVPALPQQGFGAPKQFWQHRSTRNMMTPLHGILTVRDLLCKISLPCLRASKG
jgi:hypothetical protein